VREVPASQLQAEFGELQRAFSTPAGTSLLKRLEKFCRGRETCVVIGDRDLSYVFEGRRQVYLYIQDHIELTFEEFISRYATVKEEAPPAR
jgi:hypothetical protein